MKYSAKQMGYQGNSIIFLNLITRNEEYSKNIISQIGCYNLLKSRILSLKMEISLGEFKS